MVVPTLPPGDSFAPLAPTPPEPVPGKVRRGAAMLWRWVSSGSVPLLALLAISAGLRAFRLSEVVGQLIGDEVWYVQAARVLLGVPVVPHHLPSHALSGIDPNSEHPPLAKLIMAAFMAALGDREIAWRIPSVILGTLSIALVYALVLQLGGTRRHALLAAFMLAFDNLSYIHGRIAMLDVYLVAFMLLGAWLYLAERWALSGVAFALAALCKLNGVLGLAAMVFFSVLTRWRDADRLTWRTWRPQAEVVVYFALFLILGLGALDGYLTEFHGPFEHLGHMISYHAALTHTGTPAGTESMPVQWWLNQGTMPYFQWTTTWNGQTKNTVFLAAMNDYLIFAAPFGLFYALQRTWAGTSKVAAFAIAWVAANHLPAVLAWAVMSRTSYIYYMVPVIPGLACALALLLAEVPRALQWCFAAAMVFSFAAGFPFKYL